MVCACSFLPLQCTSTATSLRPINGLVSWTNFTCWKSNQGPSAIFTLVVSLTVGNYNPFLIVTYIEVSPGSAAHAEPCFFDSSQPCADSWIAAARNPLDLQPGFVIENYDGSFAKSAPGILIQDVFGNIAWGTEGNVSVFLPSDHPITSFELQFCAAEAGVGCLGGDLTATLRNGTAFFMQMFFRVTGLGFKLRFQFQNLVADSILFDVRPRVPQVLGMKFSNFFDYIIIQFDVQATMTFGEERFNCSDVFSDASYEALGSSSDCFWTTASALTVLLGASPSIGPGDNLCISFSNISSSIYPTAVSLWTPYTGPNGESWFQQVNSGQSLLSNVNVVTLSSIKQFAKTCRTVVLSAQLDEGTELLSADQLHLVAIDAFVYDGQRFLVALNFCQGLNCGLNIFDMDSSIQYDVDSIVYLWNSDDNISEHQLFPTHGAVDLSMFYADDPGIEGSEVSTLFMIVANRFYSALLSSESPPLELWVWVSSSQRFESRQNISCSYATSVSTATYNGKIFLVITQASSDMSKCVIFQWVPGSFRSIDQTAATTQTIVWVPGAFTHYIQEISTPDAREAILYEITTESGLYLAISNFQNQSSTSSEVTIYKWNAASNCCDQLIPGGFEAFISLPAFGPISVSPYTFSADGMTLNIVGIANNYEGSANSSFLARYATDSVVYVVDYTSKSYRLLQTFPTYSARRIRFFDRCCGGWCKTFAAVISFPAVSDGRLLNSFQIYEWSAGQSFQLVLESAEGIYDMSTVLSGVQYPTSKVLRCANPDTYLFYMVSYDFPSTLFLLSRKENGFAGAFSASVVDAIPLPKPVILTPTSVGVCGVLTVDASSSGYAAGHPFSVLWQVSNYNSTDLTLNTSSLVIKLALSTGSCNGFGANCVDIAQHLCSSFVIKLTLKNWVGGVSSTEIEIEKNANAVLNLAIGGGDPAFAQQRYTMSKNGAEFEGLISMLPCANASDFIYNWTLAPYPIDLNMIDVTKSILVIPPFTLTAGTNYTITLSVWSIVPAKILAKTSISLIVGKHNPVPAVSGGDRLVRLFNVSENLLLDGSGSHSFDFEHPILQYRWECGQTAMLGVLLFIEYDCSDVIADSSSQNNPILTINVGKLRERTRYFRQPNHISTFTTGCSGITEAYTCDSQSIFWFSLRVCSTPLDCANKSAMLSSLVRWSTTPQEVIRVEIEQIKTPRVSNTVSTSSLGHSINAKSPEYIWTVIYPYNSKVLSETNLLTDLTSPALVLNAGGLAAASYTFRLNAVDGDPSWLTKPNECDICSWAQVTVYQNSAPYGGVLVVYPTKGAALETVFSISAEGWSDTEDYPLLFTFGYRQSGVGDSRYFSVSRYLPVITSVLMFGNSNDYNGDDEVFVANIFAIVEDSLGAQSESIQQVSLLYPEDAELTGIFQKQMSTITNALALNEGSRMLASSSLVSDLLNDNRLPWQLYFDLAEKAESRFFILKLIQRAFETFLPITVPLALHSLNVIASLFSVKQEISRSACLLGSSLLMTLASAIVSQTQASAGAPIPNLQPLLDTLALSLELVMNASASMSLQTSAYDPNIMEIIVLLSRASVATDLPGQKPSMFSSSTFTMVTQVVERAKIAGFTVSLGLESRRRASSPSLSASIDLLSALPDSVAGQSFEVQVTLFNVNPYQGQHMKYQCINTSDLSLFSSSLVELPADTSGHVVLGSVTKGLLRYGLRPCTLMGQVASVRLRVFLGGDVELGVGGGSSVIRISLPFDPAAQPLILDRSAWDQDSGLSSAASCLLWNETSAEWTDPGNPAAIQRTGLSVDAGYIDCESGLLGDFVASEVPADCSGIPFGGIRVDGCGVCGGQNSTCAGCDGAANSGRSAACSGHGSCVAGKCSCSVNYFGIMCQVQCNGALNCSGHGVCSASFEGLEMQTAVACECTGNYVWNYTVGGVDGEYWQDSLVLMPTCVPGSSGAGLSQPLYVAAGVAGAVVLVVLCLVAMHFRHACLLFSKSSSKFSMTTLYLLLFCIYCA